jgi:ornithine decarboxylase
VKLSEWARQQGVSYQTAWRWVKDGKMPVPVRQAPSGTWLVDEVAVQPSGGGAGALGLVPYGLTFHVGSQCTNPMAWERAIEQCGTVMRRLLRAGIRLQMLNLGGGFPARYTAPVPELSLIAAVIGEAVGRLPYQPPLLAAEPGRYLVAESGVLAASVIGVDERGDERWVYLDVGGYNGMMEAVQTGGRWHFPLLTSRPDHFKLASVPTTVTGPSCDSSDTLFYGAGLPETLEIGDRVYIGTAGAYTSSYASSFNGFSAPRLLYVGERETSLSWHRGWQLLDGEAVAAAV